MANNVWKTDVLRLVFAFACSDFQTWERILLVNRFAKSISPTCTRFIILQEVNDKIPPGLLFRFKTSKDHPFLNTFLLHHPELQEWNALALSTMIANVTWFAIRDLRSFSLARSQFLDQEVEQLSRLSKLEYLSFTYVKWDYLSDILSIPTLKCFHWSAAGLVGKTFEKLNHSTCCELKEFLFHCYFT